MARGILAVAFNFTNAQADEFHDWYDLEHIPEREKVPGFGLCERYIDLARVKRDIGDQQLTKRFVEVVEHRVVSDERGSGR